MKYLTYRERIEIETLLKRNTPVKEIAAFLSRGLSTIYKEIKRGAVQLLNSDLTPYVSYSADVAHSHHQYAQTSKGRPLLIGNDHALAAYLEHKIKLDHYSPAAALAAARRTGKFVAVPSVNTLYHYIYDGVLDLSAADLLRGRPKRAAARLVPPKVVGAPSIDSRPQQISDRSSFGHWEMDCVCSCKGKLSALLVLTERKSRYELIFKIPNKEMKTVVSVLDDLEGNLGSRFCDLFKSITVDNGSEFRDYHGLCRSIHGGKRLEVYYCHPYRSGERGSNENANSIIRRFFPKGTDFTNVPLGSISSVQDWINHYPRRILGWSAACDLVCV